MKAAYEKLDKNHDKKVTLEDIAATYDASKHPDVKAGKASPEDVFKEFMKHWDTQVKDGIITLEEFMDYYTVCFFWGDQVKLNKNSTGCVSND